MPCPPTSGNRHSLAAIAADQRTRTFRLHIEEAAWWLEAGLDGDVPLGRAVAEADVTFAQAVRMLLDGPVDGWPCDEQAA